MNAIANVKSQLRLQQWAQQIDECQNSGLSVAEWCEANSIRTNTYYYRLKRVREHALKNIKHSSEHQPVTTDIDISFKQLEVQSSVRSMHSAVIIHLPNATLEVASGTDHSTLEEVLIALRSVC